MMDPHDELTRLVRDGANRIGVGAAPVASIVRAGQRARRTRTMRAGAAGATLAISGVCGAIATGEPFPFSNALFAAGPATSDNRDANGMTRAIVANALRETPGVPLALPRTLPEGYRWIGWLDSQSQNGFTTERSSTFAQEMFSSGPIVEVCLQLGKHDQCSTGTESIDRTVGPYSIRIIFSFDAPIPAEVKALWADVDFTLDNDAEWLPAT
jgi:hypothetical protein